MSCTMPPALSCAIAARHSSSVFGIFSVASLPASHRRGYHRKIERSALLAHLHFHAFLVSFLHFDHFRTHSSNNGLSDSAVELQEGRRCSQNSPVQDSLLVSVSLYFYANLPRDRPRHLPPRLPANAEQNAGSAACSTIRDPTQIIF